MKRLAALVYCSLGLAIAAGVPADGQTRISNVLFVTMDGLRWQELFGGMQADYLTKAAGGVGTAAAVEAIYGASTPEQRRERLMPFFWTTIATQGQVFGDPAHNSVARVTNGLLFSYPGYHEMLVGFADPRIDSNDKIPNPNVTVLEWLHRRPGFDGRVASFASWALLPWIVNRDRSGIHANGDGAPVMHPKTDRDRLLNEFAADLPPYWGTTRFDAPTGFGALEYLRTRRPRVLYVMLGETDEWAHQRRYDLYLDAATRNDRFIRRLWETAQSIPQYASRTALIVSTDHGRGSTITDWPDHGRKVPAADRIWMAVLGPGIPALGSRADVNVTQAQIAATIAALLGEDYAAAQPKAAPPLDLNMKR
jgi:hypothetical protein